MTHDFHELQFRVQYTALTLRYLRRPLDTCQDLARQYASGGEYSTGRLAESIYQRGPYLDGLRVYGTVGTRLHYARYVERGTAAHIILPRTRTHLKFFWRREGRWIRTKRVHHPGMRGKHFLLRAITETATIYRMRLDTSSLIRGL